MLPIIIDVIQNEMGYKNFEKIYKKVFLGLLKKYKKGEDYDNIKFLQIDGSSEEIPLHAIVVVDGEVQPIERAEQGEIVPIKGKNPKLETFEHFFSEKTLIFPVLSEKLKIISINKRFDRIFRENLFDMINRLYGIEEEKETYETAVNEEYNRIINAMLLKLKDKFQKEFFEMKVTFPKEGEEEEKEDEEGGEEKEEK
ncbi:MAG: hypothetical protein MJ252_25145 [archaeon]|nr:hypothetical protein [archaeon]